MWTLNPFLKAENKRGKLMVSMKKICSASFLIFSLLLSACGEKPPATQALPAARYQLVTEEPVELVQELPGRVSAFTVAELRPQVSGIIQKRLFEEGVDVKQGEVLYQIDPALYAAALNNAQAILAKAEANEMAAKALAARYDNLIKTDAISRQEYDDAQASFRQAAAEVQAAQQALQTARINYGYTKITAPVSGKIGRSFVTPGALVTQNQSAPLATIQQLDPVYVDVTLPSTEILKLRRAMAQGQLRASGHDAVSVTLKLEDGTLYALLGKTQDAADTDKIIYGDLLFSDVTVEKTTGVVMMRAKFPNPENILLPGMYVRALMSGYVRENAILIPQKAVMRDSKGRAMVYLLTKEPPKNEDGTPQKQSSELPKEAFYVKAQFITLGRDYDNKWLVEEGLAEGDRIIIDGLQKVRAGHLVNAVEIIPSHNE